MRSKKSANFKWENPKVLDTVENTEKSLFESNIKGDWGGGGGHFERKISYFYTERSRTNQKVC